MGLPFDAATVLAVLAMLILAWEASRNERKPVLALIGLSLIGVAILTRLLGHGGFVARLTGLAADVSVAFLLASATMALRRARALPFLVLGLLAACLTVVLMAGTRFSQRAAMAFADPPSSASLLVELGPDDHLSEIEPVLEHFHVDAERAFPTMGMSADADLAQTYLLSGDAVGLQEASERLAGDRENVDVVEWNRTVSLSPVEAENPARSARVPIVANDPLASSQWALGAAHVNEALRLLRRLRPQKKAIVAILDTGVDAEHEDLSAVFGNSPARTDLVGHGTHCAGIAGAVANNGVGIASLNWEGRFIEILSFQALPNGGSGTYESIAQAIIDATKAGADVLSLSLGSDSPAPPRVVAEAIEYAQRQGAIVVAAAGNASHDAVHHMPSNIDGVIAVAAVDAGLNKATFSNTNTSLARPLAAPGVGILSLKPGDEYTSMNGTSMATPLVAGLVGVLRSLDPELSATEAYEILSGTGTTGPDAGLTGPVVNAAAAIQRVTGGV
ncbi:MAG TPA: S8 family serine peptidase [Rhodothermales bacterium]|nr:S8 family serine peptidase [Rhodothermales bacterium]